MNTELLQSLEQRINEAVEEISSLRKHVSDLEMQNYELSEAKNELQNELTKSKDQQSTWEASLSEMLNRLNKMDDKQP